MPVSSIAGLARGGAASVGGSRATAAKNVSLVSAAASGAPASVATGRAVRRSIAGRCRKAAWRDRRKEESVHEEGRVHSDGGRESPVDLRTERRRALDVAAGRSRPICVIGWVFLAADGSHPARH